MMTRRKLLACSSLMALGAAADGARYWLPRRKAGMPVMLYKTPGCECCSDYADYCAPTASPLR